MLHIFILQIDEWHLKVTWVTDFAFIATINFAPAQQGPAFLHLSRMMGTSSSHYLLLVESLLFRIFVLFIMFMSCIWFELCCLKSFVPQGSQLLWSLYIKG